MNHDPRQRAADAAQLLRLRELRHDQALAAHARALAEQERAREAVAAARAHFAAQRERRLRLLSEMSGGCVQAAQLPRIWAYAEAMREKVDDLVERAEYAVLDEEEALTDCDHRLDQAGAALRRARGRQDAAEGLLKREHQALHLQREQRAEREDPPLPNRAAAGLGR